MWGAAPAWDVFLDIPPGRRTLVEAETRRRASPPRAAAQPDEVIRSRGGAPATTPELAAPPPSRTATWPQVSAASEDIAAQATLDIDWIERLPAHLRTTIDVEFSDDLSGAAVARQAAVDPELKRLDAAYARDVKELRAATATRLGARPTAPVVDRDPAFIDKHAALVAARDAAKLARLDEVTKAHDATAPAGHREQSVTNPPTTTIKRLEGRALARTNFMSWAIHVTDSAEAAKQHFSSIREVTRQPGMWLTEGAATRFEAARADFEVRHPGYTFPSTDVAQAMRGFHQARQGLGMLGHALGVAFDFLAADNPNLQGSTGEHPGLNPFMLAKFGADPADPARAPGRTTMSLGGSAGEAKIEQAGKHTVAASPTPGDDAIVETVRQQFEEMSATSERFQASMADHMQDLRDARDLYFEQPLLKAKLLDIAKKLTSVERAAAVQLARSRETFPGDAVAQKHARKVRTAEIAALLRRDLEAERKVTQDALDASSIKTRKLMADSFTAWTTTLADEIATDTARLEASSAQSAALDEAAIELKGLRGIAELAAFATEHRLSAPAPTSIAATYKAKLVAELAGKQKQTKDAVRYNAEEIAAVQALVTRLTDPGRLFGTGVKREDGHWATRREVTAVSVMQYLEHGFLRNDEMPARDSSHGRAQVFNGEVAATLARFGWSPGATYGDTMHFDFIEGYTTAVPGGRSAKNMNHDRFSPLGDK